MPFLAVLRRCQFVKNKSINTLNGSLTEAIPRHVYRFESGEVLGEFLGEVG